MPARTLPSRPNLDHLRQQGKDLIKAHAARSLSAAQLIREFHPCFSGFADAAIFAADFKLSDAQLTIAREHGFLTWTRLKRRIEKPVSSDRLDLPHHEGIEDLIFRRAVDLMDAGDAAGLREHLKLHPKLAWERVEFEGGNYFRNPTLLEFAAENPIRRGTLPKNIIEIAEAVIDAGAERAALNETLGLVCSGRVAREAGAQIPFIDLLCDRGAEPDGALQAAVGHGEFAAAEALMRRGARMTLPVAAALGRSGDVQRLLPGASGEDRHKALAWSAQFGYAETVRLLLDAGEDPNRYNPPGIHSHSTPLHQAALAGHDEVARLLVGRGARGDIRDVLWKGTAADWAAHAGRTEIEAFLRGMEAGAKQQ